MAQVTVTSVVFVGPNVVVDGTVDGIAAEVTLGAHATPDQVNQALVAAVSNRPALLAMVNQTTTIVPAVIS